MKTLGTTDGDLDWSIVADGISLAQRLKQRIRFWAGEWFLATDRGVPYLPEILGHFSPDNLAEQIITAQLRTVPDVTDVTDVVADFDYERRILTYSAVVHSRFGRIEMAESPGL